jgi:hypothetical protein
MSALPPILLTKSRTKRYEISLLVLRTAIIIRKSGVAISRDFDIDLLGMLSIALKLILCKCCYVFEFMSPDALLSRDESENFMN